MHFALEADSGKADFPGCPEDPLLPRGPRLRPDPEPPRHRPRGTPASPSRSSPTAIRSSRTAGS